MKDDFRFVMKGRESESKLLGFNVNGSTRGEVNFQIRHKSTNRPRFVDEGDETIRMTPAFDHAYKVAGAYCVCVEG